MQTNGELESNGSDIDSSDGSIYDNGTNSPFRRYVSSQRSRIRVSESASEGEGEQVGEVKRILDFGRAKRVRTDQSKSWLEASTPLLVEDLGIHSRKVADLRRVLTGLINGQCDHRMVVVSGPSGSGKSTAAKLLVRELMREKMMKQNDMSMSTLENTVINTDDYIVEFSISSESHAGNSSTRYFGEFMDQCKLLTGVNEKCVVIEELPNVFHKETHNEFQRVIKEWVCTDPLIFLPPVVLILSEFDIAVENEWQGRAAFTVDNFVRVETVLGRSLMSLENILWERVRFNRVARTFMKKALQRVLNIEGVSTDESGVRATLELLSSLGDLRNGINELEFWYKFKRGGEGDCGVGEGRESGREIFHAIGKIVYGTKHEELEIAEFCKRFNVRGRKNIDVDLATAVNVSIDIGFGINSFNLSCLENYGVLKCSMNEELCKLLDVFGEVDVMLGINGGAFMNRFLENIGFFSCYGLRVTCRGVGDNGINNKKLVFSRDAKLQRKLRSTEMEIGGYVARRRSRLVRSGLYAHVSEVECATIDGSYGGIIMGSFKAKQRIYERTGKLNNGSCFRIGGEFTNMLVAEESIDIEEENEDGGNVYREGVLKQLEEEFFAVDIVDNEVFDEYDSDPIENSSESDEFSDESIEGELLKL